jgi:hypothetical protein
LHLKKIKRLHYLFYFSSKGKDKKMFAKDGRTGATTGDEVGVKTACIELLPWKELYK